MTHYKVIYNSRLNEYNVVDENGFTSHHFLVESVAYECANALEEAWVRGHPIYEEKHEKVYIVTKIDSELYLNGVYVGVYKTLESAEKAVLALYPDAKEHCDDQREYHYWFTYDECGNVETCMMIHKEELS